MHYRQVAFNIVSSETRSGPKCDPSGIPFHHHTELRNSYRDRGKQYIFQFECGRQRGFEKRLNFLSTFYYVSKTDDDDQRSRRDGTRCEFYGRPLEFLQYISFDNHNEWWTSLRIQHHNLCRRHLCTVFSSALILECYWWYSTLVLFGVMIMRSLALHGVTQSFQTFVKFQEYNLMKVS